MSLCRREPSVTLLCLPPWRGAKVLCPGQGDPQARRMPGKGKSLSPLPGCQLPPQVRQKGTASFCPLLPTWVFPRTLRRSQSPGIFQFAAAPCFTPSAPTPGFLGGGGRPPGRVGPFPAEIPHPVGCAWRSGKVSSRVPSPDCEPPASPRNVPLVNTGREATVFFWGPLGPPIW